MSSRILIAGAGAIGLSIGAMLRRAGHPVTLLGRANHLHKIAQDGLHLSGLFGEHVTDGFHFASDPSQLRDPFDLIFLTVKSYDTEVITEEIAHLLAPDGLIVSMQNGISNLDAIASRFDASRVLGCRVMVGAQMISLGAVEVTVFGEPLAIGPAPTLQREHSARLFERAREVAATLTSAGIASDACEDVTPFLWMKLFYNAALNPLGALLRLHYGALAADPDLRAIMNDVIEEAFAVATRLQVTLPFKTADEYRAVFYSKLVPATFNHRPTMLYDLEQRGRTDIDEMNGKIVELAERHGLRADTNRVLTRLIHAREKMRHGNREEEA
jgi:2-dehydropantoate 2-reductase